MHVTIGPCDPLNHGFGYQILIERNGETLLFTSRHPVTGADLTYETALEVAAMYGERPAPAPARKSLGRRWVVKFSDGELHERVFLFNDEAYRAARRIDGSVVVPCDLVPVEEGEEP